MEPRNNRFGVPTSSHEAGGRAVSWHVAQVAEPRFSSALYCWTVQYEGHLSMRVVITIVERWHPEFLVSKPCYALGVPRQTLALRIRPGYFRAFFVVSTMSSMTKSAHCAFGMAV